MPHEDGSAYAHVVATVSLGASICLELTEKKTAGRADGAGDSDGAEDAQNGTRIDGDTSPVSSQYQLPARILQEPRSLLVTTSSAYTDLLHGIAPFEFDENLGPSTVANWDLLGQPDLFESGRNERGTRVSLTYRDVLKVSSAVGKVFGAMRKK